MFSATVTPGFSFGLKNNAPTDARLVDKSARTQQLVAGMRTS
jgi:hypothetical protein